MKRQYFLLLFLAVVLNAQAGFDINQAEYFEKPGVNVMVFHDYYPEGHQTGLTLIQHDVRVAGKVMSGGRQERGTVVPRKFTHLSGDSQSRLVVIDWEPALRYTLPTRRKRVWLVVIDWEPPLRYTKRGERENVTDVVIDWEPPLRYTKRGERENVADVVIDWEPPPYTIASRHNSNWLITAA
jgi:hypothetical protein